MVEGSESGGNVTLFNKWCEAEMQDARLSVWALKPRPEVIH